MLNQWKNQCYRTGYLNATHQGCKYHIWSCWWPSFANVYFTISMDGGDLCICSPSLCNESSDSEMRKVGWVLCFTFLVPRDLILNEKPWNLETLFYRNRQNKYSKSLLCHTCPEQWSSFKKKNQANGQWIWDLLIRMMLKCGGKTSEDGGNLIFENSGF